MAINKVLLLGSGALKIGEAGEFDYSGSQAIKALKEEGIKVILVNPNIATIQTSEGLADQVYFLPVTPDFVEGVIKKEKPDGILLGFGGQTALNCGIKLYQKGVLQKQKVAVLGTSVQTIIETEDRKLFADKLKKLKLKIPKSIAVNQVKQGLQAVEQIGFPVILRAGFALGGAGSAVVKNKKELEKSLIKALAGSPQVLIEEYVGGWKEIEYEVVRDQFDNCLTVCNMENIDPMGVHTGESMVVAPSQTLTNTEYFRLREIALACVQGFKIVGECNIQFAVNPKKFDYRIIEINARLSRSSALASKATGYPLAFVAAKLALGYSLSELKNSVTGVTSAFFEPALDYVVVKIPRWDLTKFQAVYEEIGTEMKSVGEVMAIGRTFPEAIQKAVRSLDLGYQGVIPRETEIKQYSQAELRKKLNKPTAGRLSLIAIALLKGITPAEINRITQIDEWFLNRLAEITDCYHELKKRRLTKNLLLKAKKLGFADEQIAQLKGYSWQKVRQTRKKQGIVPVVKQIDTLAGEFPAKTNYLYLTYHGKVSDVGQSQKPNIAVLGAGPYRIGCSVEFDWCAVNAVKEAKKLGYQTIMINCNPETVSTDYDICHRLYFEELTLERVLDIAELEKLTGLLVAFGGQIANSLAKPLSLAGVPVLGTEPKFIDQAEDRNKFSHLLDKLKIPQPFWQSVTTKRKLLNFVKKVNFPLLLRPSYVLSGTAMRVVFNLTDLWAVLEKTAVNRRYPLVISQFIEGAMEVEVDGVANQGLLVAFVVLKHVEEAGVHSGDATIVLEPNSLQKEIVKRIEEITSLIAQTLKISGPFNLQFLVKHGVVLVIECNLRASRSFPFSSKVTGVNLVKLATQAILGRKTAKLGRLLPKAFGVKAAQFSFNRLRGADPILQIEMASTGEVGCFGYDLAEAYLKAMLAVGTTLPKRKILLTIGNYYKEAFLPYAKKLFEMGFKIYATEGTATYLKTFGIPSVMVRKGYEGGKNNTLYLIENRLVDFVINLRDRESFNGHFAKTQKERSDGYKIRRAAADHHISLLTNFQTAQLFIEALAKKKKSDLLILPWQAYLKQGEQLLLTEEKSNQF